jgi:hypothetical protein
VVKITSNFIEILIVTRSARTIVVLFSSSQGSSREFMHVPFQSLKLDLLLCFPYADPRLTLTYLDSLIFNHIQKQECIIE